MDINLTDFVIKNKNKILNLIIIIVVLYSANKIYKTHTEKMSSLIDQKDIELKKNAALKDILALEERINSYKKIFTKKDISSVINTVTDIARESQITLNSIKPGSERDFLVYGKYTFNLMVTADSYHSIAKFISKIEGASLDIYMVEGLNIKTEAPQLLAPSRLSVQLTISTILFKG